MLANTELRSARWGTIASTLLLAASLSACGGGGVGGSSAAAGGTGNVNFGEPAGGSRDAATADASGSTGGPVSAPGGTPASAGSATQSALLPQPFDTGVQYSRTLYVATDGSDSASGSESAPYRSLSRAVADATPGTRIIVREGTYYGAQGSFGNVRGEEQAPIAIVGEGKVIFDGQGSASPMHFADPRYLVLENFTVQNAVPHGMNIDDGASFDTPASHVVLRKIHFRDIGNGGNNDCLKMSGVDNFHVVDSEFQGCNQGEAIDMVGSHHGVIAGSYFHDIPRSGVQTKGGSSDVLIHGNRFVDVASRGINAGGSTGSAYYRPANATWEAARIQMIGNVFVRVGQDGGAPVGFTACDNCVFAHNTIVEPRNYVARILQESSGRNVVPSRNGYFINNIVMFNSGDLRAFVNVGAGTAPETFTFGNNLWYAMDAPGFSGPNLGGGVPADTGSVIQQAPAFVDAAGGDYHLRPESPAIGIGREVPRGAVADYDGRSYGSSGTAGAFTAP